MRIMILAVLIFGIVLIAQPATAAQQICTSSINRYSIDGPHCWNNVVIPEVAH